MKKNNKLAIAWLLQIFIVVAFLITTKWYDHFRREHSSNYQYRISISKDFISAPSQTTGKNEKIEAEVLENPAEQSASKSNESKKLSTNSDDEFYEQTKFGFLPKITQDGRKVLDAYAGYVQNPLPNNIKKIYLAVWMDDLTKLKPENFQILINKLGDNKVTFVIPNYTENLNEISKIITENKHEFFIQLPTQSSIPDEKKNDVSPFLANANSEETISKLMYLLASVRHAIGIANTTPTLLTKSSNDMNIILSEINRRGLAFLDLETTNETIRELSQRINFSFVSTRNFIKKLENAIENPEKIYIENNVLAIHAADLDAFLTDLKNHNNFLLAPVSFLIRNRGL